MAPKITKKEAMAAVEMAAVVVIGAPVIQLIPVVGPLLGKLPTLATFIALPSIVAGSAAVLIYGLVKAKISK